MLLILRSLLSCDRPVRKNVFGLLAWRQPMQDRKRLKVSQVRQGKSIVSSHRKREEKKHTSEAAQLNTFLLVWHEPATRVSGGRTKRRFFVPPIFMSSPTPLARFSNPVGH